MENVEELLPWIIQILCLNWFLALECAFSFCSLYFSFFLWGKTYFFSPGHAHCQCFWATQTIVNGTD